VKSVTGAERRAGQQNARTEQLERMTSTEQPRQPDAQRREQQAECQCRPA
jgi:hypothetical protein